MSSTDKIDSHSCDKEGLSPSGDAGEENKAEKVSNQPVTKYVTPAIAATDRANNPGDETKQTDKSDVLKDQLCDEKSKSSVSSDVDDDIVLKWDDEDEDKDKTLDDGEVDENELLKNIDHEIAELSNKEEELLEDSLNSSPTNKQSLKDPNAMLEIPTQEIIEFSDDEEFTESWKMMPDDDLDDEILEKDTISTSDEPTEEIKDIKTTTDKNEVDVGPKVPDTDPKTESECIPNKDDNLGDLLLKSLDDEEKQLDKELVNMIPFNVDSETEADDVIDLDDGSELEDVPTPSALEEAKLTEEEELQNAISGIEQTLKDFEGETTDIDKIIEEIEPAQDDKGLEQDATVKNDDNIPTIMETELIEETETEQLNVDEKNDEKEVVCKEEVNDLNEDSIEKELDNLPQEKAEDANTVEAEKETNQIESVIEDKEMIVEPIDSELVANSTVNEELLNNKTISKTEDDESKTIDEEKPKELEIVSDGFKNTISPQQDTKKDENEITENNSNSDKLLQDPENKIPDIEKLDNTEQLSKTSSHIDECLPSTSKEHVTNVENVDAPEHSKPLVEEPPTKEHKTNNENVDAPEPSKPLVEEPTKEHKTNNENTVPESKSLLEECQPSTSKQDPMQLDDGQNNVQDTSDSLGLLAESSRTMDDDEDGEDDDDGDDEDEFDPDDESSNQMTAEQSEDSNTKFESDGQKDTITEENNDEEENTFELNKETGECTDQTQEIEQNDETDKNQPDDSTKMDVTVQENADIEIFKLSDTDTDDDSKTNTESKTDENVKSVTLVDLDLEGSSSEDDTPKTKQTDTQNVTSVNIPGNIDVISMTSSTTSVAITSKEGEVVISGIPKMPPAKPARLNTSEVSIKTTKMPSLEVFNLDSDDEEPIGLEDQDIALETEVASDEITDCARKKKCVNESCPNNTNVYYVADNSTMSFYEAKKNRFYVCATCADVVVMRNAKLIEGIRNFEDLLSLDLGKDCKDPIEVLDSDSDDEVDPEGVETELVGEKGAKLLEEQLADMINATWDKFKMDSRLLDTVDELKKQMADLESEGMQVDAMLKECQASTDKLRNELYTTFQPEIQELPALCIFDTPQSTYATLETLPNQTEVSRNLKRRMSSSSESSSKRAAIPLRYTSITGETQGQKDDASADKSEDDNTDISVVKLSAEVAPADLPPPGNIVRAVLRPGMDVYAKRKELRSWGKAVIIEVGCASSNVYTNCRVKFEAPRNLYKNLTAQCLAYYEPANARMTIGTRVIALFQDTNQKQKRQKKNDCYYAGVIAEIPNPVNNYRYLIFFDHGYAQYAKHANTRLVCECSSLVWEEVYTASKEFVRKYLKDYPERPMVRLHAGQSIKTEWRGKWCPSKVLKVDASLVLVQFGKDLQDRLEWIYRGSNRLEPLFLEQQAAERHRTRALPRAQAHSRGEKMSIELVFVDLARFHSSEE
ncbi:unnamed protein product [Colias eurytheme]|nr:unnamed protein product [Colias eurytheme]